MPDFEHKGLGFHPGPVDERDWALGFFAARIRRPKTSGSQWWPSPKERLDQGAEGACVGFSRTIAINAAPKMHHYDNAFAHDLYKLAQTLDPWPGEDYEGTSVRAGAQAAKQQGLIQAYAFTYDLEEVAFWVLNKGPVCIGINWYSGLDNAIAETDYFVEPTGPVRGGHAITIDGCRWNGDDKDYFRLLNSWGNDYGYAGRAKVKASDMEKLISEEFAVSCTAVEV